MKLGGKGRPERHHATADAVCGGHCVETRAQLEDWYRPTVDIRG